MASMSLWPISILVSPGGSAPWAGRSSQVKAICCARAKPTPSRAANPATIMRNPHGVFIGRDPQTNKNLANAMVKREDGLQANVERHNRLRTPDFPHPPQGVWKTWKARPLWRTDARDRPYPCGCGRSLHKINVASTEVFDDPVEGVGKSPLFGTRPHRFSNCPESHSRVLENSYPG